MNAGYRDQGDAQLAGSDRARRGVRPASVTYVMAAYVIALGFLASVAPSTQCHTYSVLWHSQRSR